MSHSPAILCVPRVEAPDNNAVLQMIADTAITSPLLKKHQSEEIFALLMQREQVVSTAIGSGVAIPHCFVEGIEDFVVGVVTVPGGVDFAAPDGHPTKIFFFIIAPPEQRNRHVSILSEISRAMRSEQTRDGLIEATSSELLETAVTQFLSLKYEQSDLSYCEVRILVQKEELFEPVLEELSAHVHGNIAVQELRSARSYLHRIPLFATLWTSEVDEEVRLIVAVVDKKLVNEIARRIRQVGDDLKITGGVLITAQDLLYTAGGIDF